MERELAVVRCSFLSRLGTSASLAGIQASVKASITREATISAQRLFTKGTKRKIPALATSQRIMRRRRSKRSARTPVMGVKNRPGTRRVAITKAIDKSGLAPTRPATMANARNPSQSPREVTNCADQRCRNWREPNTRSMKFDHFLPRFAPQLLISSGSGSIGSER